MTDTLTYRAANSDDATDIFAVLEGVASEIPVLLDTEERREIMELIVQECCDSGDSLVAVEGNGTVVGFVLAKPDRLERFHKSNKALSLRYIGVSKDWRGQGVFGDLMEKSMAKGVPLNTSVLHTNQSAMADRLVKIGYEKVDSDDNETRLRWTPAPVE